MQEVAERDVQQTDSTHNTKGDFQKYLKLLKPPNTRYKVQGMNLWQQQ